MFNWILKVLFDDSKIFPLDEVYDFFFYQQFLWLGKTEMMIEIAWNFFGY